MPFYLLYFSICSFLINSGFNKVCVLPLKNAPIFPNPIKFLPIFVLGTSQCLDTVSGTVSSFTCQCRLGYTGQLCETNINECSSSPCQNNATCVDLVNSFACRCNGFFVGNLCDQRYVITFSRPN